MTKTVPISEKGLDLIKGFEGYRPKAIRLPNGIWVIGYGHTASAKEGAEVNPEDAKTLLLWDMKQLAPKVRSFIFAPLSQSKMDALLSLAFNIGIENFSNSDVVRYVNEGHVLSAAGAFDAWCRAKIGQRVMVVDALVRRRTAEKARFLNVDGMHVFAPSALLRPRLDDEMNTKLEAQTAQQVTPPDTEIEVSIDLKHSAALGSLLGDGGVVAPEQYFDPDQNLADETTHIYSDDDPIEEPNAQDEGDKIIGAESGTGFVKIADVFGDKKPVRPIGEVAEKIAGRMSSIAVPADEEALPPMANEVTAKGASQAPKETIPSNDKNVAKEAAKDETAPIVDPSKTVITATKNTDVQGDADDNIDVVVDAAKPQPLHTKQFPFDDDAKLPPLPEGDEITPDILPNVLPPIDETQIDELEQRNTGMFVLMGILGLVLSLGGVYETQKTGVIITFLDMIKGPGLVGLGLLFILGSVSFLIRKLYR